MKITKSKKIPKEVWEELERMQSEFNSKSGHKMIDSTLTIPVKIFIGAEIDKNNKVNLYSVSKEILPWEKPQGRHPQIKSEVRRIQRGINQYLKKCQEVSEKYQVKFDPWWLHL